MSIHTSADSLIYRVGQDASVRLRVVIGEAQGGGWVIAWDDQHIVAKGSDPETVEIGKGKDIAGRVIQVVATAIDVRSQTNRLSSTLTVTGGPDGDKQLVHRWDNGNDGDVAIFTTMIGFQ